MSKKKTSRIDLIGQNGNDGYHYTDEVLQLYEEYYAKKRNDVLKQYKIRKAEEDEEENEQSNTIK